MLFHAVYDPAMLSMASGTPAGIRVLFRSKSPKTPVIKGVLAGTPRNTVPFKTAHAPIRQIQFAQAQGFEELARPLYDSFPSSLQSHGLTAPAALVSVR